MKVMLVNGSPHEHGCTYTALCEVAKALNNNDIDTEIFWIGIKPIVGCTGCLGCNTAGKCVYNDSVNEFVAKAKDCDGFVFGSPVHYASISGAMSSFMDRVFCSSSHSGKKDYFRYKPAACCISARRAGTTVAYDQMNKYFGISEMPIISSRYWNMVHGSCPEDVAQDLEGLQTMRILGNNMAYFLKCIQAGKNSGIELPHDEQFVFTNFIKK